MTRVTAAAIVASLVTQAAWASDAALTMGQRCSDVAALVDRMGAVVLSSAPHIYDRFVQGSSFCLRNEYPERATVPTVDSPTCFIGYRCNGNGPRNGGGSPASQSGATR
jgi:hypothetical protein